MSRATVFSYVFRTVLSSALFALVPIRAYYQYDTLEPMSVVAILLAGTDQAIRARSALATLSERYGTAPTSAYSLCLYGAMLSMCTFSFETSMQTFNVHMGLLMCTAYGAYACHRADMRRLRSHYTSKAVERLAETMKASQEIVNIARNWTDIELIRCYMTTMDEETLEELVERLLKEDVLRFMYQLVKEEREKAYAEMEMLSDDIARAAE